MEAISSNVSASRTFLSPSPLRFVGKRICQQATVADTHWHGMGLNRHFICQASTNDKNVSSFSFYEYSQVRPEAGFFERLVRAWHVLFPLRPKPASNAEIAKQRLKMILISDRCAISDEAKRKIVDNVVGALSSFVEIESEEKVQLNVSADADLGTLYSVIVPVRRVKPQYQDYNDALQNIRYGDAFGQMQTLDVRFEYPDVADTE